MTAADLQLLKASIDKIVKIHCVDGEAMLAKIHFVADDDGEIIYELISTTKESQYEKHDEQPAYLMRFGDIDHVEDMPHATRKPKPM